jgi:hypothetical protein
MLIENLGLATREFPMREPDDPGGLNDLMYLRRRLLRARNGTLKLLILMAEGAGFEPTGRLPGRRFSSPI